MAGTNITTPHDVLSAPDAHQHGHDDHHDHEHDQHWLFKYFFSEDHKIIAKQFLFTGILWAFIGGALSTMFRLQLGFPEMDFSWLKPVLGSWVDGGKLNPEFYIAMVTMHGTIMVFFVLTAGLSGTFSNFLIPLQVGARDMASGFMNMLSYWFFFLSSVVMFVSLFLETGPAAGGWTVYPPLSALPASPSRLRHRYDALVGGHGSVYHLHTAGRGKLHYHCH